MAVIGHVEWVRFARVRRVPRAGEIVHATEPFQEPAGGGAVAAVQLARLAGGASLLSALGQDEPGQRSQARLAQLGVSVSAVLRPGPTRTAVTLVENSGERTITTFGERLQPTGSDEDLPWERLAEMDGVYFTAGDLAALRAARAARVLVASPRGHEALGHGVPLDALVLSARDRQERSQAARIEGDARLTVLTEGARGGTYTSIDGRSGSWVPSDPPGQIVDSYGCGDSFAAGLTYGLALGLDIDRALEWAARCGAVCLTGRGPYERQLGAGELDRG
jgi:ribokinase